MRLLVITELFLPTKGGTAVWAAEVYKRLGGREIHIVTADVPGAPGFDATHPNTVHRLKLERVPWLKPESLLMYGRLFGRSLRLALTHRFEAIHAFRALPEGLVAWLVARLTGHPVVIYAHGEELTTWRGRKHTAMVFALRHADAVIANSEFTRDQLIARGVAPEKIRLIHPGVDTERFRPGLPCDDLKARIGLAPQQRLILSVGRLSRRKGFDMVIRALPELLRQGLDVRYAVIGIGEDWDYLHALAQECGVAQRVHFLGHVPAEELPRWYNACDVFVMPNREIEGDTEGFGMVFVEAAACGMPAIAGKAGGTGAAVVDGVTGFRVDGSRVEAVAAVLGRVLADDALARRLGEAGYERVGARFSWPSVADATRAVIRNPGRQP
ncbi:MAG: glycosyltransferase family 4 protein [Burkholderiales bacterium]|nr:glycosyltransferase family 4 protein [Burkholderiales bacterium]